MARCHAKSKDNIQVGRFHGKSVDSIQVAMYLRKSKNKYAGIMVRVRKNKQVSWEE